MICHHSTDVKEVCEAGIPDLYQPVDASTKEQAIIWLPAKGLDGSLVGIVDHDTCKGRWLVAHIPRNKAPVGHASEENPKLVSRAHRRDRHSVGPEPAKK
eukprot:XP_001707835.1 Hypothetical protein GL50803_87332 [Giardia lamblia ATCC 50803]